MLVQGKEVKSLRKRHTKEQETKKIHRRNVELIVLIFLPEYSITL